MSFEAATSLPSTQGCSWDRKKVERFAPPGKSVKSILTEARATSCTHLGIRGRLKLLFIDDRLMTVEFWPEDLAQYQTALEREIGQRVVPDEPVQIDDVAISLVYAGGGPVVRWENTKLGSFMLSR